MNHAAWTRAAGFVVLIAGVALLAYAPFHAAAYMNTPDGSADASPTAISWSSAFRDAVPGAFDFADPQSVYLTFGRLLAPMLACFAWGVAALHARQKDTLAHPRHVWYYRALQAGTVGLALATFVEYYTPFLDEAFLVAVPFLLLCLVGYPLYGWATWKAHRAPAVGAWLLLVGGPAIIPLVALLGHIPIAHAVLAAGWIVIGSWLARAERAR